MESPRIGDRGESIREIAPNMLLMIDNYDSFTYNLVQYFGELGQDVRVFRNDAISIAEITRLKPALLVISPGPCAPHKPAFLWRRFASLRAGFPCSAYALAIRQSARLSVAASCTPAS
jgi:anthranilate/para-aminobenzoate synthase component II